MNDPRHILIVALALVALAAGPGAAQTAPADTATAAQADTVAAAPPPDMVILPIVNYSEVSEAHTILVPRLHRGLTRQGLTFITAEVLRPTLRRNRIRSLGWIGREHAETIARITGARYLLLGSWDVMRIGEDPEIGFSLRVLDTQSMKLVSAVSVGARGSQYMGLLGRGRVRSPGRLADRVMAEAIEGLFPLVADSLRERTDVPCRRIALIPLDSFAQTPNAGNIMTSVMITGLVSTGFDVVEPGFVRELGLVRGVAHRGGVDDESALAIRENLGACRVITGAVEQLAVARGGPDTVPMVAFGFRVMSPETGNINLMEELEGDGKDGEWFFQRGRTMALIPLADNVFMKFIRDLEKSRREDISYGETRR